MQFYWTLRRRDAPRSSAKGKTGVTLGVFVGEGYAAQEV